MKPRIALVSGDYPPAISGIGDYVEKLAGAMTALGADVSVITSQGEHRTPSTFPVRRCIASWTWSNRRQILDVLSGYDVVHIQYPAVAYGRSLLVNVLPTLLRLMQGDAFQRGPWHLGRWSRPIGIIAVLWVCFITVLFMLPQVSPISRGSFNYTPVAVLVVIGFAGIYWLVSARHWFTGPKVQGSAAELAEIERDLEAAG